MKAELSKAEVQAKELSRVQQALEQADRDKRAVAQEWQREQASLERQLQAAGKNRDQLAEQVLTFLPPTDLSTTHFPNKCTTSHLIYQNPDYFPPTNVQQADRSVKNLITFLQQMHNKPACKSSPWPTVNHRLSEHSAKLVRAQ